MSSSDIHYSISRFSDSLNDRVYPTLLFGDVARIVTLMKIALKDDAGEDSLVRYLDSFLTNYLDTKQFLCKK